MMDTSEAVTGASVSIDHYATARGDCDHCEAGLLGREVPACHTCWSILYIDRDRGSARVLAGSRDGLARPADLELLGTVIENRLRVDARSVPSAPKHLTSRETDVLTWVARGKTSAEIAIILGLSQRTINFHCDNATRRLDVVNRTQAVATAVAEGLIGI